MKVSLKRIDRDFGSLLLLLLFSPQISALIIMLPSGEIDHLVSFGTGNMGEIKSMGKQSEALLILLLFHIQSKGQPSLRR